MGNFVILPISIPPRHRTHRLLDKIEALGLVSEQRGETAAGHWEPQVAPMALDRVQFGGV